MIKGMHGMFYSNDAVATREFIRDVLQFGATDVGGGWLIFDIPVADLGVHPTGDHPGEAGAHDLSFFCDDIGTTVAELKDRGTEFVREVRDDGFGWTTAFRIPGGIVVQLYQPKYDK